MSNAAEAFDVVDCALEAWARWGRSALAGLAWPAKTLLARVIEQGYTGAAQSAGVPTETNEAMELVERAVMRLDQTDRRVIIEQYCNWQSKECAAKACGLSYSAFRTRLHRARRSIGDYLDGAKLRYNKL